MERLTKDGSLEFCCYCWQAQSLDSFDCVDCFLAKCYDKLSQYEDAEEQERLIEIPANYKDAVFSLDTSPHLHISKLEFYGMELTAIGTEDDSRYIIAGKNGCTEYFNAEHIGGTIFFSKEEAEEKLKELEACNDN